MAINLRRQNIQLPAMELLRAQVLERLISERAILQRARQTGIRVDDQMVNASVEQIARQNNLSIEELRQRLAADGVNFASFRNEIRDEITTQRLREREVNEKIDISESEIDAYLAEQAGIKSSIGSFAGSTFLKARAAGVSASSTLKVLPPAVNRMKSVMTPASSLSGPLTLVNY